MGTYSSQNAHLSTLKALSTVGFLLWSWNAVSKTMYSLSLYVCRGQSSRPLSSPGSLLGSLLKNQKSELKSLAKSISFHFSNRKFGVVLKFIFFLFIYLMHVYVFKIIRIKTILLNCNPDVLNEVISMYAKVQTLSATYGTLINLQPN